MATFHIDLYNGDDSNDGTNWANAWKTGMNKKNFLFPGDLVKISKTPDPVSIGNALWTDKSKEVVLSTPQTADLDDCNALWTNVHAQGPALYTTFRKQGTACIRFRAGASGRVEGGIVMYKSFPSSLDLSSFQEVSLHLGLSKTLDDDTMRICLCSDSSGSVVVDEFKIPAIGAELLYSSRTAPFTLTSTGGGNMGSNINSIAIVYGANCNSATLTNNYIMIDDIIATKTNGLNLNSLISKNGSPFAGEEPFCAIQSIKNNTVILDNSPLCIPTQGLGYSGETEAVETFVRKPFITGIQYVSIFTIDKNGLADNHITWEAGYNTTTNEVDGETYLDGLLGLYSGVNIGATAYIHIKGFSAFRFNIGLETASSGSSRSYHIIDVGEFNNNHTSGILYKSSTSTLKVKNICNNQQAYSSIGALDLRHNYIYDIDFGPIISISNNYSPLTQVCTNMSETNRTQIKFSQISKIANNTGFLYFEYLPIELFDITIRDSTPLKLVRCYNSRIHDIIFENARSTIMIAHCSSYSKVYNIFGTNTGSSGGIMVEDSFDFIIDNYNVLTSGTSSKACLTLYNSKVVLKNSPNVPVREGIFNYHYTLEVIDDVTPYRYHILNLAVLKLWDTFVPEGVSGNFFSICSNNGNPILEYKIAEFAYRSHRKIHIKIWAGANKYTNYSEFVIPENIKSGIDEELTFLIEKTNIDNPNVYQLEFDFTPTADGVSSLFIRGKGNSSSGNMYLPFMFFGPMEIYQED